MPNTADGAEQPNAAFSPTKTHESEGGARTGNPNVSLKAKGPVTTENAEIKVETGEGDGAAHPPKKSGDDTSPAAQDKEPAAGNKEENVDSPPKTNLSTTSNRMNQRFLPGGEAKDSPAGTPDATGGKTDEPADAKAPTVDDKGKTPVDETRPTDDAAKSPTDSPKMEPGNEDGTEPSGAVAPHRCVNVSR